MKRFNLVWYLDNRLRGGVTCRRVDLPNVINIQYRTYRTIIYLGCDDGSVAMAHPSVNALASSVCTVVLYGEVNRGVIYHSATIFAVRWPVRPAGCSGREQRQSCQNTEEASIDVQ